MSGGYGPHDVEWTPQKIARFWDDYGSDAGRASDYFSFRAGAAIAARADGLVGGLRGRRVLDFGSGRGDLLVHLTARGVAAAGLEFSEQSAKVTRQRLEQNPLFRGVTVAATLPGPLSEASFDVVFLVEVLEHLLEEQLGPTLAEVGRLLVPGGYVVITTPNAEDLAVGSVRCPDCGGRFHRWQHLRSFNPASIAALLGQHGFVQRVAEGVNWLASRRSRARQRILHPRTKPPAPHLLYVGVSPGAAR